jgi:glycosyltransferase involved in cell wall biosynthesis
MTDPLGQSQVLPYLIGLQKRGYSFTLISFEKSDKFENGKALIQQITTAHDIQWHPLPYTKTPPIISTLKDIGSLKKKMNELHKAQPFDIVHSRSYITAIAGLWMKEKWGVKFIFDMRGFWADERIDGGLWNLKNPLFKTVYNYFKRKEKQFLSNADYVISLTETAKKEIESWDVNGKFAPIQVIPCCVDLELFDPANVTSSQSEEIKARLNIQPQQKVLTYIGSIGTWYLLDEMMDFFKVYSDQHPGSIFLFVTKDNPEEINKSAASKGISLNAIRIQPSERKQVPAYIAASDYSIFFIKPAFSKKASSPTKQGEIMAMGIPVICNDNVGDTSVVVKQFNSGLVVTEFSNPGFQINIKELDLCVFNSIEIREGAAEFFSLKSGIEKYATIYEKLTL